MSTLLTHADRSAIKGQAVTGSPTFDNLTRAIYVGVEGDLPVTFSDGTSVTIQNAYVGYHPLQVASMSATGRTATGVVALF